MKTNPKTFLFGTAVVCVLLFIGLSIPLILGKIDPNPYYGIHIDKSLEAGEKWYAINRYGGWALIISGILMLIGNAILFAFRKKLRNKLYLGIFVGIMMICVLVAAAITTVYANQLIAE